MSREIASRDLPGLDEPDLQNSQLLFALARLPVLFGATVAALRHTGHTAFRGVQPEQAMPELGVAGATATASVLRGLPRSPAVPGTTKPATAGMRLGCAIRSCRGSALLPAAATGSAARAGTRRPLAPPPQLPFALSRRPLPRRAGCGRTGATLLGRCFGENAAPKHLRCASETRLAFPRNIRCRAKALSGRGLAIRAVHPGQGLRQTGRAGAPPRKRPWLVQAGLSERSLPGILLAGR